MRKIAFLFLVFSIFAYTRPRYGGRLRLELLSGGSKLSWDSLIYESLIYSNLLILDKKGDLKSYIFSNWYEEKGEWHFKLRGDLLYNDSTPILPQDIANSIGFFLKSDYPGSLSLSRCISSIGVRPPDEIVIKTVESVNLPLLLSTPYLFLKKNENFSGPFVPRGDSLIANPFFPAGRPFLDEVRIVSPPEEFDLGKTQGIDKKPINSRSYIIYLLASNKYWKKMSRRAIFTFISSLPWEKKADSYLPPSLSQFSLDFPVVRRNRIRALIRKKLIISIPPLFSPLLQQIESTAEVQRIRAEIDLSEAPLEDVMEGKSNAALLPSQAVFTGSEAEELAGVITRFSLSHFFPYLSKAREKLMNSLSEGEKQRAKIISSAYDRIASKEFLFPIAFVKEKIYLNQNFVDGGSDFYGRPYFWTIRRNPTSS